MAHIKVRGNVPGPRYFTPSDLARMTLNDELAEDHGMEVGPPRKFSTTNLAYPLNVEGDSQLGHYIMFFINVIDEGALQAQKNERDVRSIAYAQLRANTASAQEAVDLARLAHSNIRTTDFAAARVERIDSLDAALAEAVTKQAAGPGATWINENKLGSNSILLRNIPTKRLTGAISLYMPPNITVNYESKWGDQEISVVAETGYEILKAFMRSEGAPGEAMSAFMEGGEEVLRQTALAMLGAVAPGAKTLFAIERGKVITPKMEVMFEGIGRRNFSYVFTFIPKSAIEAKAVHNIVYQFKYHMAANYVGGGVSGHREMEIPNLFDIQYMHIGNENQNLNKIGTCALIKVDVEYGGDKYVSHEGGVPQTTKLTLNFTELEIITKDHIAEGF